MNDADYVYMLLYILGGLLSIVTALIGGVLIYAFREINRVRSRGHDNRSIAVEASYKVSILDNDMKLHKKQTDLRLERYDLRVQEVIKRVEDLTRERQGGD